MISSNHLDRIKSSAELHEYSGLLARGDDDVLLLLDTIATLERQLARWKKAIEGLTPSGSEYVNDPEACAVAIKYRTQWPRQIIELREQLATAQRERQFALDEWKKAAKAADEFNTQIERLKAPSHG